MMLWLFAVLGLAAGAIHAHWLARVARGVSGGWSLPLRMGLVAAVLVPAALNGALLVAAAGWFAGSLLWGIRIYRHWS